MDIQTRKAMIWVLAIAAALVSACDSDPIGSQEGSYLQASIQSLPSSAAAIIDIQHNGRATWGGGTKHTGQRKLQISSRDRSTDRQLDLQRLSFSEDLTQGFGPFLPGVYTLVPRNFTAGDGDGFTASYFDYETGNRYISESGTWTITEVSVDRVVSGHFDFIAAYWCNPHNDRERCFQSPAGLGFRSDALRLHIRGDFQAVEVGPVPEL